MPTFPHLLATLEPFEKTKISHKHLQNALLPAACASVKSAGTAAAVPANTAKQKRLMMLAPKDPKGKRKKFPLEIVNPKKSTDNQVGH